MACRAAVFGALVPDPEDEAKRKELVDFINMLCTWENSLNKEVIGKAREIIRQAFNGETPRVLDCFAGGGAIPLEALRLGCEAHALELNPVAGLILLCTLVYPQKYGQPMIRKVEKRNGQLVTTDERIGNWLRLMCVAGASGSWKRRKRKSEGFTRPTQMEACP